MILARVSTLLAVSLLFAALLAGGAANEADVATIRWLAAVRADSPALTIAAVNLTQAGSVFATLGCAALAATWLLVRGQRRAALFLAATVAAERLLVDGVKLIVARPRPSIDAYPLVTHSSSFPSGHAANSMTAFLALALWLAPPRWRTAALTAAVLASLAVGATRPLLGVHWPSDVLAGWLIGALCVAAAWRLWTSREDVRA